MIVRRKPALLNAWQLNSKAPMSDIPHWVMDFAFAGNLRLFPSGMWVAIIRGQEINVSDGDYLLLDSSDNVSLCYEAEFNYLYEAVK